MPWFWRTASSVDTVVLAGMSRKVDIDQARIPAAPLHEPAHGVQIAQVGGGRPMHRLLNFRGPQPIWDAPLLRMGGRLLADNVSLSPTDYPHSAEDLAVACRAFAPRDARRVAVFSSISPWAELTLLARCAPARTRPAIVMHVVM